MRHTSVLLIKFKVLIGYNFNQIAMVTYNNNQVARIFFNELKSIEEFQKGLDVSLSEHTKP